MPRMDNAQIGSFLSARTTVVEGQSGYWRVVHREREVLIVTDEHHDRMRIMTPVDEAAALSASRLRVLLEANFDRALDAKFAIGQSYVWSAFLHPLTPLTEAFFADALDQVVTLGDNYGTTYTSSALVFGEPLSEDLN